MLFLKKKKKIKMTSKHKRTEMNGKKDGMDRKRRNERKRQKMDGDRRNGRKTTEWTEKNRVDGERGMK